MESKLSEVARTYYGRKFMEAFLTAAGPEPLSVRPSLLTSIDEELEHLVTLAGYSAGLTFREDSLQRGLDLEFPKNPTGE